MSGGIERPGGFSERYRKPPGLFHASVRVFDAVSTSIAVGASPVGSRLQMVYGRQSGRGGALPHAVTRRQFT